MEDHQTAFSGQSFQLPEVVQVGDVRLGGDLPVRIQSMTNTPTSDTKATVNQCILLIESGCELVRITAQNAEEANNLALIRKEVRNAGYHTPLIADIHFNSSVADVAAQLVEKVRINPGNYSDKRFVRTQYSESDYEAELSRIAERLKPLLNICNQHGTAIRIGTNHGSLSGRIMQRYGDTPRGMAESAMEFVRICHGAGFHNLVLSMKSSNVRVMVAATRLLVQKMKEEGMYYPLHLGVTEAGNGLEGRIKSAAGIGTLLAEGIGDTIRVSLTEPPENEIPVARQIVSFFSEHRSKRVLSQRQPNPAIEFHRRKTIETGSIGAENVPVVLQGSEWVRTIDAHGLPEGNAGYYTEKPDPEKAHTGIFYYGIDPLETDAPGKLTLHFASGMQIIPVLKMQIAASIVAAREFIARMDQNKMKFPVLLSYSNDEAEKATFATEAAMLLAPLLIDGQCDGIRLINSKLGSKELNETAFAILQATRARITQTEYIACPGCGRTRYKLEEAFEKVKQATSHLKGLKIAVMGCVVNGPGEMADADFGYVGQGNGKVTLYKGRQPVRKNVPENDAVAELIALLEAEGRWRPV